MSASPNIASAFQAEHPAMEDEYKLAYRNARSGHRQKEEQRMISREAKKASGREMDVGELKDIRILNSLHGVGQSRSRG